MASIFHLLFKCEDFVDVVVVFLCKFGNMSSLLPRKGLDDV